MTPVRKRTAICAVPALLAALALPGLAGAHIVSAGVERDGPDRLTVRWQDSDPVDLYEADRPDTALHGALALARDSDAGQFVVDHAGTARRYFILVDRRDHHRLEVAERVVPLQQASNFRDIGGYVGAGGKHVRWGLIYRSAGQPLITPADNDTIHALNVGQLVDLRSSEERVVAPTRITGIPYAAVGYAMSDMMTSASGATMHNGPELYRKFPLFLAPQLRLVFAHLLHENTAIVYNCSAGQDRTGFVTAMVLSALGVSYDTIVADYHLSTRYRRTEYEMPPIDPALVVSNPGLAMFANYHSPAARVPQPLIDASGQPFLRGAFAEIDAKWGSVDGYLRQVIGLTPVQIALLRARYLE